MIDELLYGMIRGHCCRGCDGYQCPNHGAGDTTDDTVTKIIQLLESEGLINDA